jgi:exonuclease V gamma subunit
VVGGYSKLKPKREVEAWVRHLALCGEGQMLASVLIGRNKSKPGLALRKWEPMPAARARELLTELMQLYHQGQSRPLPFLPEVSYAYFAAPNKQKDAHQAAVDEYDQEGKDFKDPYPVRAFDGLLPPFDPAFEAGQVPLEGTEFHRLALRVFEPLVAGSTGGKA